MALLQDLIQQIDDPALKERILQETNKLLKQKKFGLVFEEHLPECTPLYDVPVRRGSKVSLRAGKTSETFTVLSVKDGKAACLPKNGNEAIEYAVDELVSTAEFGDGAKYKVIDLMPEQRGVSSKGGTMRLGAYPCKVTPNTIMARAYGKTEISERHRHRYEFNNEYREILTGKGLIISGTSPDGNIVETVEENTGRFFVGVQFHPEFKSRPNRAHPLFREFIKDSLERSDER